MNLKSTSTVDLEEANLEQLSASRYAWFGLLSSLGTYIFYVHIMSTRYIFLQSSVIAGREVLYQAYKELEEKYPDG